MSVTPLEPLPIEQLRQRSSAKWRIYPEDVLPLFVAETDFPLAEPIAERLRRAVDLGDTGYTPPGIGVTEAYAGFAQRRFGWEVDPARCITTCDVMMGVVEVLRAVIEPGDRVIVTPPVYPPFYECIPEAGGVVETVPLADTGDGWTLDLVGIESALVRGARAVLLCNPHNPTGTVHTRATLARLAEIVAEFDAVVVSDEIHAPLVQPGVDYTPFLSASETAARVGFACVSASKAFNLAGLKCAVVVTAHDDTTRLISALPIEVQWRTSLFGALAAVEAFSPACEPWLDALVARLDINRRLLAELLAEHVPEARYRIPDAGYLAWVDLSALGWGDDPARRILKDAGVALHFGPQFGEGGDGHVRINFGCSAEVLGEAVERIGALARS